MDIEHLTDLLPSEVAHQVTVRWAQWQQQPDAPGATAFLTRLHSDGLLSASQLGDALGRLDVQVTLSTGLGGKKIELPEGPRYLAVGELGRGAMGEVHVARDVYLNRNVALKHMTRQVASDPGLAAGDA